MPKLPILPRIPGENSRSVEGADKPIGGEVRPMASAHNQGKRVCNCGAVVRSHLRSWIIPQSFRYP